MSLGPKGKPVPPDSNLVRTTIADAAWYAAANGSVMTVQRADGLYRVVDPYEPVDWTKVSGEELDRLEAGIIEHWPQETWGAVQFAIVAEAQRRRA